MRQNHRKQERGIVLVAVCLCLLMMMAGLGLGVDLSRLLAAQQALASSAEAVALGAVLELDGTAAGLERARNRAASTWRRQEPASGASIILEFAASPAGPWSSDPLSAEALRAARVHASSTMPLSLLRSVVRETSLPVNVVARAGQAPVERVEHGLLPFAVDAGGRLLEGFTVQTPLAIGEQLPRRESMRQPMRETLEKIVRSDSDATSSTYAEYSANGRGNGRRLVQLAIVDSSAQRVTGFGAFLLLPSGGVEQAGGYLEGSRFRANAPAGSWRAEVVKP